MGGNWWRNSRLTFVLVTLINQSFWIYWIQLLLECHWHRQSGRVGNYLNGELAGKKWRTAFCL